MEAWRSRLAGGDSAGAWDLFIARYRPLILSVIRRTLGDDDDVDDVFAELCGDLSRDDLALPAGHIDSGKARFSTWLVAVVHHRTIDWVRRRDGRHRSNSPTGLSPLQQQIFQAIVSERRPHIETYELLNGRAEFALSFREFMNEVRATYRLLQQMRLAGSGPFFRGAPAPMSDDAPDPFAALLRSEHAAHVARVMQDLPPDERLAIQLFVIDDLSAASVAEIVGWQNAKMVYNRVSRALIRLRRDLEHLGVTTGDEDAE